MDRDESKRGKHMPDNLPFADDRIMPPPPKSSGLQGAFHIKSARYPWQKATSASLSMGLSLLVGWILGHMEWGLLTTMGAFTALYVHNEPYFQRALKLALVAAGLAASFGIGTLSAGSVWSMALALGVVSAVATFLCGAWKVPSPSAYFFILVCAVGTGLPIDPTSAPLRAGLALLGGGIAWFISMSGWLVNAHGPETSAVANAYRALGVFLSTIGNPENDAARHNATLALRSAEDAVMAGELRWRSTEDAHRLFLLIQKANALFLAGIAFSVEKVPISPALAATVRALADTVSNPDRAAFLTVPHPTVSTQPRERLFSVLSEAVDIARTTTTPLGGDIHIVRPSVLTVVNSTFSRHSVVLPATLRIGIAVVVATLIAAGLGNQHPYWVPLTVACVLQGATVPATVQRTVQRAIGTSLGVLLGGGILAVQPRLGMMVVIAMVLQLVVELIIVRNYAIAVVFITPIPLVLAEMGQRGMSPEAIVQARLFDTLLGCTLGLAAALSVRHPSSSVRV
ncbi:FUSC family protein [Alicyclobacillus fastidiosus]|uniref:FUSC family protein n=1 Tax=Alicyclobacillus fastidiosus TaxID=392011 RepID=A0ABY6ZI55_9BACL|nr:FUSC family protein [Alicyclobacillus fastidiosus]WAH42537.1 FUSC family protein [Alicyclobacillus fastidiosus]GMA64383.1 putative membrane protein YvaC [Alicyclobacillus fastidiosus]